MRNVAICGSEVKAMFPGNRSIRTVAIKGVPVTCGLIVSEAPLFDPRADENRFKVLVKTRAFSCNYRDLSFIFAAMRNGPPNSFLAAGSDFVGEVVEVGSQAHRFKTGDRVIADNRYTMSNEAQSPDGVLTSRASKEYQIFPEAKLIGIPSSMPDEVAAAFSIGAQTAYSMIRKLDPVPGANVLVTSARSNTALFAINALKKHNVNIYAMTTSADMTTFLHAMGVKEVLELHQAFGKERVKFVASSIGGFNCVIDPFFDLHLEEIIDCLAPNGRYITCGLYQQYQRLAGIELPNHAPAMNKILLAALVKNLQIIGNCLGTTQDLRTALDDYAAGCFSVVVDEVFAEDKIDAFFHKTFNASNRIGKVVYKYN